MVQTKNDIVKVLFSSFIHPFETIGCNSYLTIKYP